jgi:hypothetical protein
MSAHHDIGYEAAHIEPAGRIDTPRSALIRADLRRAINVLPIDAKHGFDQSSVETGGQAVWHRATIAETLALHVEEQPGSDTLIRVMRALVMAAREGSRYAKGELEDIVEAMAGASAEVVS